VCLAHLHVDCQLLALPSLHLLYFYANKPSMAKTPQNAIFIDENKTANYISCFEWLKIYTVHQFCAMQCGGKLLYYLEELTA